VVRVTKAKVVRGLNGWLLLDFDNNEHKFVDIKPVMKGVLDQLHDQKFFEQVYVDPELGTITWPGELDLDPDNLYRQGIDAKEIKILAQYDENGTSALLENA